MARHSAGEGCSGSHPEPLEAIACSGDPCRRNGVSASPEAVDLLGRGERRDKASWGPGRVMPEMASTGRPRGSRSPDRIPVHSLHARIKDVARELDDVDLAVAI